jgi:hypothetical protein
MAHEPNLKHEIAKETLDHAFLLYFGELESYALEARPMVKLIQRLSTFVAR